MRRLFQNQSFQRLSFWALTGCFFTLVWTESLFAQPLNEVPAATRTFAIERTRIVQQPGQVLENATLVIRDGSIMAIGPNAAVPFDAERIAGDSLTVYAGFIDGLSHVGIPAPKNELEAGPSNNEQIDRANPPDERAGIQPNVEAFTLLDASDPSIAALRNTGFTTAHVVPHGRMLPGQGAIVLLAGARASDMVLKRDVSLFAQFSGARGVYPATPMGVMAKMRQLYREAERRKMIEESYASNAGGTARPDYDATHYAFFPVIEGELPVFMYTASPLEIYRALRLRETLGYSLMLGGLYGGFESIDLLLEANVPLFLTLKMPKDLKTGKEEKDDSTEVETTTYDPSLHVTDHTDTDVERMNLEERRKIFHHEYLATAALMYDAGLNFGFSTKDVKPADIHKNLRLMIQNGLPEDAALASLTTNPARILGLSQTMGTVEQGKIANLVVTTGPLFDEKTKIKYVFVDGRKFEFDVSKSAQTPDSAAVNPAGTWNFTINDMGEGVLTINGSPGNLSGSIDADGQTLVIQNVEIDGNLLTFNFDINGVGAVSASLTLDGDSMEGSFDATQGVMSISGQKIADPEADL